MAWTSEPDLEIDHGFSLTIGRTAVGSTSLLGREKFAGPAPIHQQQPGGHD